MRLGYPKHNCCKKFGETLGNVQDTLGYIDSTVRSYSHYFIHKTILGYVHQPWIYNGSVICGSPK
jgi:hypothetical protein